MSVDSHLSWQLETMLGIKEQEGQQGLTVEEAETEGQNAENSTALDEVSAAWSVHPSNASNSATIEHDKGPALHAAFNDTARGEDT